MRTLKLILGIFCLVAAFPPGGLALLTFLQSGGSQRALVFSIALILAALAISLIGTGWFLIARRNSPITRRARILILVSFSCLGIFVAITFPNFIKARSTSAANACINNLRQIDAAAQEFALENRKTNGEAISYPTDLTPYIKLNSQGKIPPCPQGGIYSVKQVGDTPTCSLGTNGSWGHVLP
ncbi:MAG TPA: hypothetical protein VMB80_05525 [Candidatus Acidoferrum sp.]|nr:hypothetical protein [Candidatus Acidoferrum sp.]